MLTAQAQGHFLLTMKYKYKISIDQHAAVVNGFAKDLDLIDLAIFDFIKDFANSPNCAKIQTQAGVFFWISHKLVLEQMPLLKIKTKRGLMKRIDNLINAGILSKHPDSNRYNKTLYSFGENYDLLVFANEDLQIPTKDDTYEQKFAPMNENSYTYEQKFGGPMNKSSEDNIYNDNIDNNIKKEKYKKEKKESPENKFSVILDESENINFEESKQTKTQTLRGTTEPNRCLFANSRFARFEDFEKCFDKPEYKEIDIRYYYNAVADWSASKGRMQKDWIAQTRNFMRKDKNKGELHLKPQYDTSYINIADALDFLNENF